MYIFDFWFLTLVLDFLDLNDLKVDLVTPRTENPAKYELNGLENPENCPQEILIQ